MKTLVQMIGDMRTDLKDSGALWSADELTRCVERAVADYSRFLPKEESHELTVDYTVTDESFTMPATTNLVAVVSAQSIDVAAGEFLTIAGQPDVPRKLRITITDADSSTYQASFIIVGTDKFGKTQTEVFHYSRGQSKTLLGSKEFKTVYTVELDQDYGSHAGDTASVGYGLYSDDWIYLTYKPVKPKSETVTSSPAGTSYTRDTDYTIDYANGRIKAKAGKLAAVTAYLIDYTKSQIEVDLDSLPNFLGVNEVVYPETSVPQDTVSYSIWKNILTLLGKGVESQQNLADKSHVSVRYYAAHTPPQDAAPGDYPEVVEDTIVLAAEAYALFIMALKYEHQAVTDIAYVDTALDKIADELDGKVGESYITCVDKMLANAEAVWSSEDTPLVAMTTSLTDGDGTINTVNVGADVPELWRRYSETYGLVVRAWEQKRADFLTEAARYIDKANLWLGESQARIANVGQYLEMANRFRMEAMERRNEAWTVWANPRQYTQYSSTSAARQPDNY